MSSSDRFQYLTATVLDQTFLDQCADNLACDLEMIAEIEAPDLSTIYASDRNKYVGTTFYEALLQFPSIGRNLSEWLQGTIDFSNVKLALSNVDGRFNKYLPGGADYDGWVGRSITIKMGLRDVASTYTTIFQGTVTPDGGFGRDVRAINLIARDNFDRFNRSMPTDVFTQSDFPFIQEKWIGKAKPLIYGDFTTILSSRPAIVPAFPVNGDDTNVVTPGGARTNVQLVISVNPNRSFVTSQVWLRKSQDYFLIEPTTVTNVNADNNYFEIEQEGILTDINGDPGDPYEYDASDEFFVQVTGKDLGAYSDNFVAIARDALETYGGAVGGDFEANWDTYRDKSSPPESAISSMLCRLWQQESINAMSLALSLLEEVRLEAFIDRNLKLKINSLHFEDFDPSPSFKINNWDVVKDTMQPNIDLRNNFTKAKGFYSFMPDTNDNEFGTLFFSNDDAITQSGREIVKGIVFPNHYIQSTVEDQTIAILQLASSFFEVITLTVTWRSLLLDIGDFVLLNVQIGSTLYENVPCLVREIAYNPVGLTVSLKLWSFQLVAFPGYTPVTGSVGGYDAGISEVPS